MKIDDMDVASPTAIMGVTNILTAYLPERWSRFFPLIPIVLGVAYALAKPASGLGERLVRAITGLLAIGEYSVVRNATKAKPLRI